MRESIRRRFDWIYEGKRRRALRELYSGDPADPDNTARIMRRELFGPPWPIECSHLMWVLHQYWVRSLRHHWRRFLRK